MGNTVLQEGNETLRSRATALYTFLKEFTELRSKTIRTFDQYEHILWFSNVPRGEDKLCDCAAWHRGEDREGEEIWLEIRQPRLIPAPEPPAELEPWLVREQVCDSSLEMPELLDEIAVPVNDESGEERLERRRIEDHVAIKSAWERYVESDWWPWAEEDRKKQLVQRVYTALFSIYQKQHRLGEQYEVVLGLGVLVWRTPDGQEVRRHIVTANTELGFDAARGVMIVGPAGEGAKMVIEQDMLDPKDRPNPDELLALEGQIAEIGDRVWEPTPVDALLAGWVHAASPKGIYRDSLSPPERVLPDPQVNLAPALILRKRTERSYIRAFDEIINQLQKGASIPPGVAHFVTVAEDSGRDQEPDKDSKIPGTASDLYFPLESNEAQRQIVERLRGHQGVLVQGPPGTGKSHTIVNLICHLLASGQRVLVTSHTARALKVLQRYMRERTKEISPLAVVLLGDDRDALQAMEDSVQGITYRQNHWDPKASAQKLHNLQKQLDEARREEAQVLEKLRSIREQETYVHPVRFGGYNGTLQGIATQLQREEEAFNWIEDRPDEAQEPPISSEQFQELLSLLRNVDLDEWSSAGWNSLTTCELISPNAYSTLVSRESTARAAYADVAEARHRPEYALLKAAPIEARKRLAEELSGFLQTVDQIRRHLLDWTDKAVFQILGDFDRAWRELFEITKDHLSSISSRARWADETPISGLGDRDHHEVRADAEALLIHLEGGGRWGMGPFRAQPAKRGQYFRREVKVAGRICETPKVLKDLIAWLDVEERLRLLLERWAPYQKVVSSGFASQVRDFEDFCEPLETALGLHEWVARIRVVIQTIPGLAEPTWHELDTLRQMLDCVSAVQQEEQLGEATEALAKAHKQIALQTDTDGADPIGRDLVQALQSRDETGYRNAFSRAVGNEKRAEILRRRDNLLKDLRANAPLMADELSNNPPNDSWDLRAPHFSAAWNWARARAWLNRLTDPDAEYQLRLQFDLARDRIRNRLYELASEKAWGHCFDRMTENERQHLVAWSKAVRSIGKGTGKYTAMHRRNAREHMNECRSAIPAWVMPLHRVAETIKPGTDLFDVVIIDEASQSGPEALLLAYLAKKLVVVGDDKQISPTYAGINHEDVNQIRARHIADLPHSDSYGVHQSFFDLAEIRYQGRIRLREHFRCMPEIIQFSNTLCYASEPLIPLRQYGESRLSPVVSARHVPSGYLKGTGQSVSNPPEAQAIVDEILRMHSDPAYEGKTFGVISLQGQIQAREIESLLLEQLGPKEMEQRQLVCGDAYAFQGDERDVMLLSLVSAPSEGRRIGTLSNEAAKRRFNVAASRARDQLFLFHTATVNDLSRQCLRYALLQYCQNPSVEGTEVSGVSVSDIQHLAITADRVRIRPPEPFESWFEVDVFLKVVVRGYRVLPQYSAAGYRIDLVVEGMDRRIAVECDGDEWHGPEQYEADTARERVLERCGWVFCRIRGSAFYLDKDGALEDLWGTLERVGVYPAGYDLPVGKEGSTDPKPIMPAADQPELVENAIESPQEKSEAQERFVLDPEDSVEDRNEDRQSKLPESEASKVEPVPAPFSHAVHEESAAEFRLESSEQDSNILLDFSGSQKPYANWRPQALPDPRTATVGQIIEGLAAIISAEGPMVCHRAYFIYARAVEPPILRVGRQIRSIFNMAITKAIRQGVLESNDEHQSRDTYQLIVRKIGTKPVVVRKGGNRPIEEIPPSELGAVMIYLRQHYLEQDVDELLQKAAEQFEIRRITSNIRERLLKIMDRYTS